jgi:hypothetical protein
VGGVADWHELFTNDDWIEYKKTRAWICVYPNGDVRKFFSKYAAESAEEGRVALVEVELDPGVED